MDGVEFYQEQLSQSVFQRGQGRTGTLCLGVFNALSGEARWIGNILTQQDITWSYDGGELMLQTPEISSLLVLSIPFALLSDITDELPNRVYSINHSSRSPCQPVARTHLGHVAQRDGTPAAICATICSV
ncbi:MAG: hypothetical protein ACR5LD_07930 [Symbiopectobacterium sp.]